MNVLMSPDFSKQNPPEGPPGKISSRFCASGGAIPTFCVCEIVHDSCEHAKFGMSDARSVKRLKIIYGMLIIANSLIPTFMIAGNHSLSIPILT